MGYQIVDSNPGDPRVLVPNIEFYITNVCNLTCTNCNRFNDYDFKGWQRWSDYANVYADWATKIRLQRVTILGGEPLLNPSLLDWVDGINSLWGKSVQVLTNGTRLNSVPDLYDRLIKFTNPEYPWARNWIAVSLHNPDEVDACFAEIRKFLRGDIRYVHKDDPDNIDNCYTAGGDHSFTDSNGMQIRVWEYNDFYTAAITRNQAGRLTLHNSDVQSAHDQCGFAAYKCYHFIKGGIYKCGPVALFPDFDKQHPLDITDEDRQLINSYKPLLAEEFDGRAQEFFATIDNPIPQCKFCPEKFTMTKLQPTTKKAGSTKIYE